MIASGACIRHCYRSASCDFPLDIQIPLGDVIALRVWSVIAPPSGRARSLSDSLGCKPEGVRPLPWIRQINFSAIGRDLQGIERKHVRKRQNVEKSDPPANGSLARVKWIPRKSDPGLKIVDRRVVLKGLVVKARANGEALRIGHTSARVLPYVLQLVDLILRLGRNGCHFVTQADIQRQVGTHLPVILDISGINGFPVMMYGVASGEGRNLRHSNLTGYILEETLNRFKRRAAAAPGGSIQPVVVMVEVHEAKLDAMGAYRASNVVIHLQDSAASAETGSTGKDSPLEPTLTPGAVHPGSMPRVWSVASGLDVETAGLNKSDLLYPNRSVFTIAALKTWFSSNV